MWPRSLRMLGHGFVSCPRFCSNVFYAFGGGGGGRDSTYEDTNQVVHVGTNVKILREMLLQFPNQSISPTPGGRSPTASGLLPTRFFTVPEATVEYVESRYCCNACFIALLLLSLPSSSIAAIFAAAPLSCRRLPLPLTAVIDRSRRLPPSPPSSTVAVAVAAAAVVRRRCSCRCLASPSTAAAAVHCRHRPPSPLPPPLPAIKMASRADHLLLD